MSIKSLVGKRIIKKVAFMGSEVEVRKLSVSEIMEVQKIVKKLSTAKTEDSQLSIVRDVIRIAVVDADKLTDEDFNTFPLAELNELTEAALAFSGLTNPEAGN